jgi:hypothetical protein
VKSSPEPTLSADVVHQTLAGMATVVRLADDWVADGAMLAQLRQKTDKTLASYLTRAPLRIGMPREELRRRLDSTAAAFDVVLAHWHPAYEACGDGFDSPTGLRRAIDSSATTGGGAEPGIAYRPRCTIPPR